ncbi:hypothetical protein G8758_02080 [Arthrobacter woluwensis]|nr:SLC13 family permease [Arthrobacter woluwensis]QTF70931.1 hypothetical protein G8758_02080 [Arthrobacter woluwensis]
METELPELFRRQSEATGHRFTFHSARAVMKTVNQAELAAMVDKAHDCAVAVSDAAVDVIGYACLVAVMAQGRGAHAESERVISEAASGNGHPAEAVSSAGALVRTLRRLGARRIAMVTPYMQPLTDLVRAYIEAEGIEVMDAVALEVADNLEVGRLDPAALPGIVSRLRHEGADALVLSACVQMPSLAAVQPIEDALGLPVITAATATAHEILLALGQAPQITGAGRLLSGGDGMITVCAFGILILAFAIGSLTSINAGLVAIVATFFVGLTVSELNGKQLFALFPAELFFTLVGTTLLFGIVRATQTIDLLAQGAERLARGRRGLVPVLMFLLTAALASFGAFTPAAVAIVAPVALPLARRFRVHPLAMGLVIVEGANAGAFSPVNPFGVVANRMLADAGAAGASLQLYLQCLVANAVLGLAGYLVVQWWARRRGRIEDPALRETDEVKTVGFSYMRILSLTGILALLILTLGFGLNVAVASLGISLVLIVVKPSVQKQALAELPWSAILLVSGIVMYVGLLEAMGAVGKLEELVAGAEQGSVAALLTSYIVAVVSAFASTTGTLSAISPLVASILAGGSLSALGVVTTISISSSVVDVSPMSTTGALLMASAKQQDERLFFRMLLAWALVMVLIVPVIAWVVFVLMG